MKVGPKKCRAWSVKYTFIFIIKPAIWIKQVCFQNFLLYWESVNLNLSTIFSVSFLQKFYSTRIMEFQNSGFTKLQIVQNGLNLKKCHSWLLQVQDSYLLWLRILLKPLKETLDALSISNFPTVQFVFNFFYVLLLNIYAQLSFDHKRCFSSSFFYFSFPL